ncbi:MAG: N-acetylneuraminate synthase [Marinobacter sp.]|uniref:N-acetylneuraminate synthase n=1 Tax=Marinobacter sp. TaxID=50741 RepID=UPI00299D101F|nr:N-acetylneuraminate synthase [Marinobacter sp.]MDX1754695.1 N-acetylneuraminate synthase [Marinobacter sp.]
MNDNNKVQIIAEAGVNHNGDRDAAFALVDVAAASGASAVKFQTFSAQRLAGGAPKADYQQSNGAQGESQQEMLARLELPESWHVELQRYARSKGIEFLSTAFDLPSFQFLRTLDLPVYKVPSGELTNAPLLWAFANSGVPLIVSTGMASLGEVEQALAVIAHGYENESEPKSAADIWQHWSRPSTADMLQGKVTLLHCTSQYPAALEEVNLAAMDTLAHAFGLPVGYSDHTLGTAVPVAAVARGARVIEKHFTLDRSLPGPDHRASLEPEELADMVRQIRTVEAALGSGLKRVQPTEWNTRQAARQQIVAARAIRQGQRLSREDLTTARAGQGLSPMHLWDLVGLSADSNYKPGDVITVAGGPSGV